MEKRFEVDEEDCIGCSLCSERAPSNLEVPAGSTAARVFKQPESPEEADACRDAADYCPTGALDSRDAAAPSADPWPDHHPARAPAGDATPADIATLKLEN